MIAACACRKSITRVFNANQKGDIMRGQVVAFSEEKNIGVVATGDGPLRLFHLNDWRGMVPPQLGMAVSFKVDEDGRARQVQLLALPDPAANAVRPDPEPIQPANPRTYTAE